MILVDKHIQIRVLLLDLVILTAPRKERLRVQREPALPPIAIISLSSI